MVDSDVLLKHPKPLLYQANVAKDAALLLLIMIAIAMVMMIFIVTSKIASDE